jgi:hypothetical protein
MTMFKYIYTTGFLVMVSAVFLVSNTAHAHSADTLTRTINFFFPDTPVMVEVARCESGLRHTTTSGSVLRGGLGGNMVGVFQLYDKYHREAARTLGYDIDSMLGNIAYARELYRAQGLTPWNSSRSCWGGVVSASTQEAAPAVPGALTSTLRFGSRGIEVSRLQDLLRTAGHGATLRNAANGVFDIATYRALIDFQCAHDIACLNGGPWEGLGTTGPATREALMQV